MKKAIFALLAALALTLAFALGVSANEVVETGSLSDTIRYTLYADGKMVIEGTGEIPGYYPELGGYFYDIFPNVTRIEIKEGITTLGNSCFYYMEKLSSVSLPSTLKTIRNGAFGNCSELQNVILPEGLEVIGTSAFLNCKKLTQIVIPASVKTIMDDAFGDCDDLVEFVFLGGPHSLSPLSLYARDEYGEDVSATAYYPDNCGWTQEDLTYPGRAVTWIPYTLDSQGNRIYQEENAFVSQIEQVTSGTLGENGSWYIDDAGVLHIQANEGDLRIQVSSTYDIYWKNITGLVLEHGVKGFYGFFHRYEHLRTVTFTDALESCPEFEECKELESFDFGKSATTLPSVTEAHQIRELVIPATVEYIYDKTFFWCQGLEEVTFLGSAPATIGKSCFAKVGEVTFYYPAGDASWTEDVMDKLSGSQAVWIPYTVDETGNRIPDSKQAKRYLGMVREWGDSGVVSTLYADGTLCVEGTGTFNTETAGSGTYMTEVLRAEIGEGIIGIGNYAFGWCEKLTEVSLPDGLEEIGDGAFFNCLSLTAVDLPDSLKTIGDNAFKGTSLVSVEIPGSVKTIGDYAFTECPQLSKIILNEGLEYIGSQAFRFTAIRDVVIPSTVLDIKSSAFSGTKLENITFLTKNITSISEGCFADNPIKTFIVPAWINNIEYYAFAECEELSLIVFEGAMPEIDDMAFAAAGEPVAASLQEYADSFSESRLESARLSGPIIYSVDETGNYLTEQWDSSKIPENMEQAKALYPEGYPLGQYSVSKLNGGNQEGYGSQAFAYIISDFLFRSLPSEMDEDVSFDEVQVGDILRLPEMTRTAGNGRAVVVIEKNGDSVTVVQGDWHKTLDAPGTVHWGEVLSRVQVEAAEYRITRYSRNLLSSTGELPSYEPEWPSISGAVTEEAVHEMILSLKDSYPEGFPYSTDIIYATKADNMVFYPYGQGCSAFAYRISDMAFGTAPMRYVEDIFYDDIMVGDILQYDPDPNDDTTHVVVVMEVYSNCVVTVEANYGDSMHWGGILTKDQVESMMGYYTRYPEGTDHAPRQVYSGEINDGGHEHRLVFAKTEEPTCLEQGYSLYRCDCGKEEHRDFVEPLGHSWVEATCDAPKTCSACGVTDGEPLGHRYADGICTACGAEEPDYLPGDVDGDGALSYNDALTVLRGSIGLAVLTPQQELIADFDGDGGISYNDALMILRASIGL